MTGRMVLCPHCGHEFRLEDRGVRSAAAVNREAEARRNLARELIEWRDAGGSVEQLVYALDFYLGTVIGRAA